MISLSRCSMLALAAVHSCQAFLIQQDSHRQLHPPAVVGGRYPSPTGLFSEPPRESFNKIIGIDRGVYILGFALLANVWLFSIPPEFRRAKICSEEQVIQFPDSNCMTASSWVEGVQSYYSNGGGVKFDFSVEKASQPAWMGGELENVRLN